MKAKKIVSELQHIASSIYRMNSPNALFYCFNTKNGCIFEGMYCNEIDRSYKYFCNVNNPAEYLPTEGMHIQVVRAKTEQTAKAKCNFNVKAVIKTGNEFTCCESIQAYLYAKGVQ